MARDRGSAVLTKSYDNSNYLPLDTRQLVPTKADLTLRSNWEVTANGKTIYCAFNGMIVAVAGDSDSKNNGVYRLWDPYNPLPDDEPDATSAESWHKLVDLSELEELEARVLALETSSGSTGTASGITEAQLTEAINSLKQEIALSGYLTEASADAKYASKADVQELSDKIGDIDTVLSRI